MSDTAQRQFRIGRTAALALLGSAMSASLATAPAHGQTAPVAPAASPAGETPKLDKPAIDALLASPEKVLFLDVRRADEISQIGGFPAFLNIQITELDRFLSAIPRDRQIVTVSNHAGRAQRAAKLLAAKGFTVIGAVGVQDYAQEGGFLYGQTVLAPAIPGVVAANTRVEVVREGFEGTEGPIALPDGSVLFTENRADRIVKLGLDGSVSTYLEKTGGANALALSAKGELLAVQTAPSGIAVLQPQPKVLAAQFEGKPFNRPNDFALARSGHIYFSDPGAPVAAGTPPPATPPKTGFYWLDPKGKVRLIADDIRRPNGVALSPDEKTVYVANTAGEFVLAWTVNADGSLTGRRDFAKLAGFRQGPTGPTSGADGIVVDKDGRVFVTSTLGIEVFSPEGTALGVIPLPKQPQNLAFGGPEHAHLYAVGRGSAYRIATLTRGVDRPGK
ncbi:SMP-30/gluconolactonase/LRE family protein [Erythrobacter sp. NE805]|uniref:SMP-30/gluconolactonase/LRE family protein n=1 Tax=Erythrobacter sp. NE805 TaxID=3389875 RepID=UPI00396B3C11